MYSRLPEIIQAAGIYTRKTCQTALLRSFGSQRAHGGASVIREVELRFRLGAISIALVLLAALGNAQAGRIVHIQPGGAISGQTVAIEASIEEAGSLPSEARIYYRASDRDAFAYVEMRMERFRIYGDIPAGATVRNEIEYYLQVELTDGAVLTAPEGAPLSSDPYRLSVRRPGETVVSASDALVILSPNPGESVPPKQVLVAVSILQPIRQIDSSSIRIYYDGTDRTSSARITSELVVLPLATVRPGVHTVTLYSVSGRQREKLLEWSFVGPQAGLPPASAGMVAGGVSGGWAYEEVSENVRRISYLDAKFNGRQGGLEWAGRAYLSSMERGNQQPQNRFVSTLKYGAFRVTGGDAQPRFSEFTLWGVRARGVELNLRSMAFNLDFATGELRRDVEGHTWFDTTVVVVGSDTLKSQVDPTRDSTIIRQRFSYGTYGRQLTAIRPGFPISDNLTLSINVLKARDQVSSIAYGRAPKDNLVFGADIEYLTRNRKFRLTSETAVSMVNNDISGGAMKDAKQIEDLIVVNQHFDPLPTDTSIIAGGVEPVELAGKLWSELIKSSMAHRTDLMLNLYDNEFKVGYKTIGRSFRSFGSPTVLTDVAGLSIQDRIRLLNNRLYLTIGYETYADNVNGRATTTTDRNIIRAALSVYSPPAYPNVNLGFRTYDRKNDGKKQYVTLDDGRTDSTDTRVDNVQNSFNVSADQSFRYFGWDHLASLGFNTAVTDDKLNPAMDTDLSTISLNLVSRLQQLWEWRLSGAITSQTASKGTTATDYTNFNLMGRYSLIPNQVWLNGSVGMSLADGAVKSSVPQPTDPLLFDSTPRQAKVNFSRTEFSLWGDWTPNLKHSVTISLYQALHGDDGFIEYWSGRKDHNKDRSSFVDQDDRAVRLIYGYKL